MIQRWNRIYWFGCGTRVSCKNFWNYRHKVLHFWSLKRWQVRIILNKIFTVKNLDRQALQSDCGHCGINSRITVLFNPMFMVIIWWIKWWSTDRINTIIQRNQHEHLPVYWIPNIKVWVTVIPFIKRSNNFFFYIERYLLGIGFPF